MRMTGNRSTTIMEFGFIFTFVPITSLLLIYARNPSFNSGELSNGYVYIVSTNSSGVISDRNLLLTVEATLETNCECVILNASVVSKLHNRSNQIYVNYIDFPEISDDPDTLKFYFRSEITRFELSDYVVTMEWEVLETDEEFYPIDPRLLDITLGLQDIRID